MHGFWIRIVSVIMICNILFGYNMIVDGREKEDELARLSAQVVNSQSDSEEGFAFYEDGIYSAEATGFGGPVVIELQVEQKKLTQIKVVSAEKEDGAYLSMAQDIIPAILEKQSTEVDTISGATFSSGAIKEACAKALEEAGQ